MMKNLKITVNDKVYKVIVEDMDGGSSYSRPSAPSYNRPSAPSYAAAPASAPTVAALVAAEASSAPAGGEKVNAPLNGTVLTVKCTDGKQVKRGDILLTLEAMKMENEILSPCDGTIASVSVKVGDTVENGALLCVIK